MDRPVCLSDWIDCDDLGYLKCLFLFLKCLCECVQICLFGNMHLLWWCVLNSLLLWKCNVWLCKDISAFMKWIHLYVCVTLSLTYTRVCVLCVWKSALCVCAWVTDWACTRYFNTWTYMYVWFVFMFVNGHVCIFLLTTHTHTYTTHTHPSLCVCVWCVCTESV